MSDDEILIALKEDLRIDGNDMDNIVARKKAAAEEYIKNAGCNVDYENPLFVEIITRIVGKMIDNPELETSENGMHTIGLIEQLRLSQNKDDT